MIRIPAGATVHAVSVAFRKFEDHITVRDWYATGHHLPITKMYKVELPKSRIWDYFLVPDTSVEQL